MLDARIPSTRLLALALFAGCVFLGSPAAAASSEPIVEFVTTSAVRPESWGLFVVEVNLSEPAKAPISVPISVAGTATGGVDYQMYSGPFEFQVGESSRSRFLAIVDDHEPEMTEEIVLLLGEGDGFVLGPDAVSTLVITDDDPGPGGQDTPPVDGTLVATVHPFRHFHDAIDDQPYVRFVLNQRAQGSILLGGNPAQPAGITDDGPVHYVVERPDGPGPWEARFSSQLPNLRGSAMIPRLESLTIEHAGGSHVADQDQWTKVHASGPLMEHSTSWRRFVKGADERFGVLIEHEAYGDDYALVQVLVTNGIRSASDFDGSQTDGDLHFHRLIASPPPGFRAVFAYEVPSESILPDGTIELVTPRSDGAPRFLRRERPKISSFALVPEDASPPEEQVAIDALRFRNWCRSEGLWSYNQAGGFGPAKVHLANFTDDMTYHNNPPIRGWNAVEERARYELDRDLFGDGFQIVLEPLLSADVTAHRRGLMNGAAAGGREIWPNSGHFRCPDWLETAAIRTRNWSHRNGHMVHTDGDPVTTHDFAAQNGGTLPWTVNRTVDPSVSVPWSADNGHAWNASQGTPSPEEEVSGWYQILDHAHSVRQYNYLATMAWLTNSQVARYLLRCNSAWYAFAISLESHTGQPWENSIPNLEQAARLHPLGGNGGLGRQAAWPLMTHAAAFALHPGEWRIQEQEFLDRFVTVVQDLGGRRRRIWPTYGSANPVPDPNWSGSGTNPPGVIGENLLLDQTFETVFTSLACYAAHVARGRPIPDPALGMSLQIARDLNSFDILHGKWHAYGKQTMPIWSAENTLDGFVGDDVIFAPEEILDITAASPGSLGSPHQGNLIAIAVRESLHVSAQLRNAYAWAGLSRSATPCDLIQRVMESAFDEGGWLYSETNFHIWNLDLVGLIQSIPLPDCDGNGTPDLCESDCDGDGVPDRCEGSPDCDANGVPDECDILAGEPDCNVDGIPDICESLIELYCQSTPNSTGQPAQITEIRGSNSISAADLTLVISGLPDSPGVILLSPDRDEQPFGSGYLCVGTFTLGYVARFSNPFHESDGELVYVVDHATNAPPVPELQLVPGFRWNYQAWFRDSVGSGFNFSDAAAVVWCP